MKLKNSVNKELNSKIVPHNVYQWKSLQAILNILAILIMGLSFYLFFNAAKDRQFFLALIGIGCFTIAITTFLTNNPSLYNKIEVRKKIVPIKESENIPVIYNLLSQVETPYGRAQFGQIYGTNIILPFYILKEENYQIFIFAKKDKLIIKLRNMILNDRSKARHKQEVKALAFLQSLTDLCCYIVNTKSLPSNEDLSLIFTERNS